MTIDIDLKATLRVGLSVAMLTAGIGAQAFEVDRTHLPIAEPDPPKFKELDVRNVETPPLFSVKAPEGAPNVIIVLIDDVGFGATTTFGGPINTPTMDRLAAGGLRYNNFHTTALCSPTRNALKTGRNHHQTNTGSIMETATAFPGNTGKIPNRVAPLAEMRRLNGYSTGCWFAALGLYGQGAALLNEVSNSNLGNIVGWPMLLGLSLIVSNYWAYKSGEWNSAKGPFKTLMIGLVVLVVAAVILGYSNTL